MTLAKKPDKKREYFIHKSVEAMDKLADHLQEVTGSTTQLNNYVSLLDRLAVRHYRWGKEPFFSLDELAKESRLSKSTTAHFLAFFVEKGILKRATKFTTGSLQSRKAWYAIVDRTIINIYNLGEIISDEKPSEIDEANSEEEKKELFYRAFNEAIQTKKYHHACESMGKMNLLTKNILFLFAHQYRLKHKVPYIWDRVRINGVLRVIKEFFHDRSTHCNFDYFWIKDFINKFDPTPKNISTTVDFYKYVARHVRTERDIPPKMSFAELYQIVMGKEFDSTDINFNIVEEDEAPTEAFLPPHIEEDEDTDYFGEEDDIDDEEDEYSYM